jgi:hypothetical protein
VSPLRGSDVFPTLPRAYQAAEKVGFGRVLKGHGFSRAVKSFIFDPPHGL